LALYWLFLSGVGVQFAQSSRRLDWKQGPIPEEIYQTLLTNKKQGNLNQAHADDIIKAT
jgi:hypothetical protein